MGAYFRPLEAATGLSNSGTIFLERECRMARKKAKRGAAELIISKARTKGSVKKCNVSGDFYGALDKKVREIIADAEKRAVANKRKTLKPQDI